MEFDPYISCIKIKGVPILPPLITPERRKELQTYRNQALSLEDVYNNRKLTRKKIEDCSEHDKTAQPNESNLDEVLKGIISPMKYVPYPKEKKVLNLSTELLDVSEYSSALTTVTSKCSIGTEFEATTSGIELEETTDEECKQSNISSEVNRQMQKPRLIRSNSYTLDNPSPLLLAHLERQKSDSSSSDNTVTDNLPDSESYRISAEMLPVPMEKNDSFHVSENEDSVVNESNTLLGSSIADDLQNTHSNAPIVEVVTTDITVQQINITTSINEKLEEKDIIEIINNNNTKNQPVSDFNQNTDADPMNELKLVLQQIPEEYSRKIVELIEKQTQEQSKRTENYENMKQMLLQSGDRDNSTVINVTPTRILVNSAQKISESVDAIDKSLKNSFSNGNQSLIFDMSTSCSESLDTDSLRTIKIIDQTQESNRNAKEIKAIERKAKEEKAASIIGAYAKGYLVRRLMKTSKVKQLIQTIQEALICALEMRASDTLEEADIELHRRLIAQISAACYEFHDVFFALTIPEQMELIAVDREHKKRALKVKSIRSTGEFQSKKRRNSGVRLTKSLTNM